MQGKNDFAHGKGLHRRVKAKEGLRLYDRLRFIIAATAEVFRIVSKKEIESSVCSIAKECH